MGQYIWNKNSYYIKFSPLEVMVSWFVLEAWVNIATKEMALLTSWLYNYWKQHKGKVEQMLVDMLQICKSYQL